ncbi:hypothetical protein HKX48_003545 [Thoreauomyces humboldtii]|nr:hypothetical protein HKX48_003545 [Thoreauomyces humboldtii]
MEDYPLKADLAGSLSSEDADDNASESSRSQEGKSDSSALWRVRKPPAIFELPPLPEENGGKIDDDEEDDEERYESSLNSDTPSTPPVRQRRAASGHIFNPMYHSSSKAASATRAREARYRAALAADDQGNDADCEEEGDRARSHFVRETDNLSRRMLL